MKNKKYSLYDKLEFGKFKDKSVKELIDNKWSYVNWCVHNIEWFKLNDVTFNYFINNEPFEISDYFDPYSDDLHFAHDMGIPEEF